MLLMLFALFIGAMSLLAFLAFRSDKRRAARGEWRVSESSLLTVSFFGGWLGAKLAQRIYRHKTRKEPFRSALNVMVVGPVLMFGFALVLQVRTDVDVALVEAGQRAQVVVLRLVDDLASNGVTSSPETVTVRRGSEVSTVTLAD